MRFSRSTHVRHRGLILGALLVLTLLPAGLSRAQSSPEDVVKGYFATTTQELDQAAGIAQGLRTRATWAVIITVVAAFLSLMSGTLPQLKKKWAKTAALALGFIAGTTTILNNNLYSVDSALLEDNSYELEREIATVRAQVTRFGFVTSSKGTPDYFDNLLTWYTDTERMMSSFRDRRDELRKAARRRPQERKDVDLGRPSPEFFATLHAQVAQTQQRAMPPAWVQRTPAQDERFIYFVGKGIDPDSLTDAKTASERDAFRQAEEFLAARANSCPIGVLRDRAGKEAEIVGTHFASGTVESSNMRAYTYSTLLRLNKTLANPSLLQVMAARAAGEVLNIPPSRVATSRQLGGSVGVFAGPAASGSLRVLVFNLPNVATRWPSTRNVRYEDLKRSLSPSQVLQDATLEKCGETSFRAGDSRYALTVMEVSGGADRSASIAIGAEKPAGAKD